MLPSTAAHAVDRAALLQALCSGAATQRSALGEIVAAGTAALPSDDRAWALRVVAAMRSGSFVCRESAGTAILGGESGASGSVDGATLAPLAEAPADSPYVPSIVMMRALTVADAELELFNSDAAKRLAAAVQVDKSFAALSPAVVARALAAERDTEVKQLLTVALAKRGLGSEVPEERLKAITAVAEVPSESARTLLGNFLTDRKDTLDSASVSAAQNALRSIDRWLTAGHVASVAFSGLSYAGILLITALGLSIVFGLLGVINLAHGEFIMLGAYATYLVEQFMKTHVPGLFDAYILVAIPAAFVVCGLCGMLLEVCVIRFLYRRPLETLLATWAVSIALVKAVQLIFGSQNVEFITPGFLNGGMQVIPGFFITWNRVFAIVLALLVFAGTYALIHGTRFGLLVRATTQRRDTARSLGVSVERIDRLAFGLGSGLAGIAGVVLTQIASVNPSMGTSFVIDAFMVVVLGGAGSLIGTAASSLALGEINQIIEPVYGAVAAKVAVLLLIVVIIQRRPQGLFSSNTRV
jgi:urea transport system permease protein